MAWRYFLLTRESRVQREAEALVWNAIMHLYVTYKRLKVREGTNARVFATGMHVAWTRMRTLAVSSPIILMITKDTFTCVIAVPTARGTPESTLSVPNIRNSTMWITCAVKG